MTRLPRVFVTRRDRWRALATLLAVLAVWLAVALLARRWVPWLADPVALRETTRGYGALAPLAFVLLQAAQVVVAPVPGQVLGLAAGYLFGTLVGTVVSVVGAAIGSYVAFRLSRRFGRSYVERMVDPAVLDRVDDLAERRGLTALFLAFLVPGLPDDAICFVFGLTDLDVRRMTLVSAVGRVPGYFVVALVGAGLAREQYLEAGVLLAAGLLVTALAVRERDRILRWLEGETGNVGSRDREDLGRPDREDVD